jgi:hypothetical protein
MMTHEEIFLKTLDDIRSKMNGGKYELVKACGLLRHLLIDSPTLYDLINTEKRFKLQFELPENDAEKFLKDAKHWPVQYINITYAKSPKVKLKVDEFRKYKVLTIRDTIYSIKDLIDWAAHIMGGVHTKEAKKESEKKLSSINELILSDYLPTYELIKNICVIAIKAFDPLEQDIKGRTPAAGL